MLIVSHCTGDLPRADVFAVRHRDELARQLWSEGALLLRGFGAADANMFSRTVRTFARELMDENGEHVPTSVSEYVYRPVEYDPSRQLLWHNENSFDHSWPLIIAFCCVRPAELHGATTLVTSEQLQACLHPALKNEFVRKGVRYVRRMGLGVGRTWQQVFRTDNRKVVESRCRARGFDYSWLADDVLETTCVRPAVVRHPVTGAMCWFNQMQHWHPACLDAETRAELIEALGIDRLPRDCSFGDGTPIADDLVAEILSAYHATEKPVQWQAGDILIVDNVAVAHGRQPYRGTRELLVAMGAPQSYSGSDA